MNALRGQGASKLMLSYQGLEDAAVGSASVCRL